MDIEAGPWPLMPVAMYGYLALFLVLALEELGVPLPLPGDLVLLFAGYLVGRGAMRFDLAVLTVVLAAFIGAPSLYLLAQCYGRPMVARYGRYVHLDAARLAWLEARSRRWGPAAVLVSRVTPGMRIYTSILAGLGGVRYPHFATALGPAALLWAVGFIFLGSQVGQRWEEVAALFEHHAAPVAAGVVLLLVFGALAWRWREGRVRLQRQRSGSPQAPHSDRSGSAPTLDLTAQVITARAGREPTGSQHDPPGGPGLRH